MVLGRGTLLGGWCWDFAEHRVWGAGVAHSLKRQRVLSSPFYRRGRGGEETLSDLLVRGVSNLGQSDTVDQGEGPSR